MSGSWLYSGTREGGGGGGCVQVSALRVRCVNGERVKRVPFDTWPDKQNT